MIRTLLEKVIWLSTMKKRNGSAWSTFLTEWSQGEPTASKFLEAETLHTLSAVHLIQSTSKYIVIGCMSSCVVTKYI